jgi:hypothetical protein
MNRRFALALVLVVLAFGFALPASAQLDPGNFEIRQNGRKVGEIFVPARAAEATSYVEHWVLFDGYVYPGEDSPATVRIKDSARRYASEADFFARVRWEQGFRYVRIDVTESDRLPGR